VEKNFEKRPLAAGEHLAVCAILCRKAVHSISFSGRAIDNVRKYAHEHPRAGKMRTVYLSPLRHDELSDIHRGKSNQFTDRPRLAQTLSSFRERDGGGACSRHGRGDVCARCVDAPQFRGIHDRARARRECFWRPRSAVPEILKCA
jgi:hypothetical protein